jgi:hypothetical protein
LKKVGTGRMFERSAAELSTGTAAQGKKPAPTLYRYGRVHLPSGPAYIDLSAWPRDGSYQAAPLCMILPPSPLAPQSRAPSPGRHLGLDQQTEDRSHEPRSASSSPTTPATYQAPPRCGDATGRSSGG